MADDQVFCLITGLAEGRHPLKKLILTLNSCHDKGIQAFHQWLIMHDDCQLEYLDLSHQKDEHRKMTMLEPLAEALKTNRTLQILKLSRNRLDAHDIESLLQALRVNPMLRELDLRYNMIGNQGIRRIAQTLCDYQGLQMLSLSSNEAIGNDDLDQTLLLLVDSLKRNRGIEFLDLGPTVTPISSNREIQFYISLNWAGRRLLSSEKPVPLGLWPIVLERSRKRNTDNVNFEPDILYSLLRESNILTSR